VSAAQDAAGGETLAGAGIDLNALSAGVQAPVRSVTFDRKAGVVRLHLAEGCADMAGVIALVTDVYPEARLIETFVADSADTSYVKDGSDWHALAPQTESENSGERRLNALAKLPSFEYEKQRKAAAEALGVRATVLDAEVAKRRERGGGGGDEASLGIPSIEPAAEAVVGADVLDAAAALVREHVICDVHTATAAALWAALTYLAGNADCVQTLPLLVITSPEKRCGKTQLLGVLSKLVQRPLSAGNVSAAAIFRVVEKAQPTLLIDESDTFLRANTEIRGIVNCGHTRASAYVLRCTGDEHEPRRFSTWCPKVLAGIGKLAGTLEDRAIVLPLRRKLTDETVARVHASAARLAECARRLARFAADAAGTVRGASVDVPDLGSDRAADNWTPLLALADVAGGEWPARARQAAIALTANATAGRDSYGVMLLADIREFFVNSDVGKRLEAAPTKILLGHLEALPERPWGSFGKRGKALNDRQLAKLLEDFGISSRTVRSPLATGTVKGYLRAGFEDAWHRYLPPPNADVAL
jgi:putative DNA primase/helicase